MSGSGKKKHTFFFCKCLKNLRSAKNERGGNDCFRNRASLANSSLLCNSCAGEAAALVRRRSVIKRSRPEVIRVYVGSAQARRIWMHISACARRDAPGKAALLSLMDGFVTFATGGAALELEHPHPARIRPSCRRHTVKPWSRFSRPTGLIQDMGQRFC